MLTEKLNLVLSLICVICNANYFYKEGESLNCKGKNVPEVQGDIEAVIPPMNNCEDTFDRTVYGICYFNYKDTPENFTLVITHIRGKDASTHYFFSLDKEIIYNKSERILVRKNNECVVQTKVSLPIRIRSLYGESAFFGCKPNVIVRIFPTVRVQRIFQACRPVLTGNFDMGPLAKLLGNSLTLNCKARVGTDGELAWLLLDGNYRLRMLEEFFTGNKKFTIRNHNWTDPTYGPMVKSKLFLEKPRHLNSSRVVCLSGKPVNSFYEDADKGHYLNASVEVRIIMPSVYPRVTIDYHDKPNIVYIGENVTARCAALVSATDRDRNLRWQLRVDNKIYNWFMNEHGVGTPEASRTRKLRDVHFYMADKSGRKKQFWVIQMDIFLKPNMFMEFQSGTFRCLRTGSHVSLDSFTSGIKKFEIKTAPRPVSLTKKYVSRGGRPFLSVKCSSYVGSNGYISWWLYKPGGINASWAYDSRKTLLGTPWEGVNLFSAHASYDRQFGTNLYTSADIKVNHEVDLANLTCISSRFPDTHLQQDITDTPRVFYNSVKITIEEASREFSTVWPKGRYKKIGWTILLLVVVVASSVIMMDVSNYLWAPRVKNLSQCDSTTSSYSDDSDSTKALSLHLDFEDTAV